MLKARKQLTVILLIFLMAALNAQPYYHTLKKGETLYSLSRTYGVSVQELMSSNEITSPENLIEGLKLLIPTEKTPDNHENSIEISENTENVNYTVKKGDTFYRIAKLHGMSVNELLMLNHFSGNNVLKPGDVLIVKGTSVSAEPIERPPVRGEESGVVITSSASVSWPVEGVKKTLTGKLRGITIEAAEAALVQSVASGKVVWTGPYRGFGQVVLVDVNGYIYLYGGNEDIFVNVGEYVPAGARIGRLGNSGLASRTVNMYFSVFKDGIPVSVVSAPRG